MRTVQVLIPFGGRSGGVESLYQLAHGLCMTGVKVEVVFTYDWRSIFYRHRVALAPEMAPYGRGLVVKESLTDHENVVIVVPEIFTNYIRNIRRATACIYWLSVDNYYIGRRLFQRGLRNLLRNRFGVGKFIHPHFDRLLDLSDIRRANLIHLAQSRYAEKFLETCLGTKGLPIQDYVSGLDVQDDSFFYLTRRTRCVLYNPLKGLEVTRRLIQRYGSQLSFIPIKGLSHEGVRSLLRKSSFCIDFGEHPGRDRLPREAILSGCCVITGRRGSAAFQDVPIDERYKLWDGPELVATFGDRVAELEAMDDCKTVYSDAYAQLCGDKQLSALQLEEFVRRHVR